MIPHIHNLVVCETPYELEAHLRRCDLASQRDAVRMLLLLRTHSELSDFEVGELIGRAAHDVHQWWRIYQEDGLRVLLQSAETALWHIITGAAVTRQSPMSALPFDSRIDVDGDR